MDKLSDFWYEHIPDKLKFIIILPALLVACLLIFVSAGSQYVYETFSDIYNEYWNS